VAAARGFRVVAHDYSSCLPKLEDSSISTPVDAESPISPTGGFVVAANPWQVCFAATMFFPRGIHYRRVLLVEYDDTDTINEYATDVLYAQYAIDAADPTNYAMLWRVISTDTIVEELVPDEYGPIDTKFGNDGLADTVAVLGAHGWGDWTPTLVP
jgi:hypothetical protein